MRVKRNDDQVVGRHAYYTRETKIGRVTEFSYVTLGLFIIIIKYDHQCAFLDGVYLIGRSVKKP